MPEIRAQLSRHARLILEAAPGAGKTSRVPLALLEEPWLAGQRIVMLEPRRLAARSAARHMAGLLGEPIGRTVGYRTAVDGRESAASRILVVTEGILTRMIQADPLLEGIGCVIFDEFHERSLQADLGLALCLDSQQSLRPDLRLVAMSATLDGERLAAMLDGCPRLTAPGRVFPVQVRHLPPPRGPAGLEDHVAAVVRALLRDETGSILVFLPGAREIRRTAERLGQLPEGVKLRPLYGELGPEDQDAALAPSRPGERKIVLATNIAESSLTIEGVRLVVDSGLVRAARFEPAWGMDRLVTERVSRASAEQRAGRAGRLEPGLCLRLWPEHEQAALRPEIRPEILEADLASLCLEVAAWGLPVGRVPQALRWLDAPPGPAWEQARSLLRRLDALDAADRCTRRGLDMVALPLHPRLAHMVLEGKKRAQGLHACALAALFSERDPLRSGTLPGADVRPRLALLLDGPASDKAAPVRRLQEQARRIARRARIAPDSQEHPDPGQLLALAWPERVALRRGPGKYLLANGRGAALLPDDPLAVHDCLAVAALHNTEAGGDARIHLAAPLDRALLESLFADRLVEEERLVWDAERQAVSARAVLRLDALTLREHPLPHPPEDRVRQVLLRALASMGLDCLPWTDALRSWQRRVLFLRTLSAQGRLPAAPWPDCSDPALAETLESWLGPYLESVDRLGGITPTVLERALKALLPWPLPRDLDRLAPESLTVPSGSSVRLEYGAAGEAPVLAVKLQELFGLEQTPTVAGGAAPVTLHLLSPAGRPVQITSDLAGFWKTGYQSVRADLRGRYPKHPWPDDPLTATPSRFTQKGLRARGLA